MIWKKIERQFFEKQAFSGKNISPSLSIFPKYA